VNTWASGSTGCLPAGRRPSTIAGYRRILEHDVIPAVGHIELQALRTTDLDALYSQLLERGLAMSTVRKLHVVVRKAVSDAERKETGVAQRGSPRDATGACDHHNCAHHGGVWQTSPSG